MQAKFVACYEPQYKSYGWKKTSGLQVVNSISEQIQILCDNLSVVFYSKNNISKSGFKHVVMKYLVVGNRVKDGLKVVENIGTEAIIANPLILMSMY